MSEIFGHKNVMNSIEDLIRNKLDSDIKNCVSKVKKQVENSVKSSTGAIYASFMLNKFKYDLGKHHLTVYVDYKNLGVE